MTLAQLEERVTIGVVKGGHFKVTIEYNGKVYSCISTNTMASDCIRYGARNGYTRKQAFKSLYDYCKLQNNIRTTFTLSDVKNLH